MKIRGVLLNSRRPYFIFHDDPDGLASFLQLYRACGEGKWAIVKSTPRVDETYLERLREYQPDTVFILDIAMVDQEFIDKAKTRVVWIDHHAPIKRFNVDYFNPRIRNKADNQPVSYLCYEAADKKEDLWIMMVGVVGDWCLPKSKYTKEFAQAYPELWGKRIVSPDEALFNTRLGELIMAFSFILKGKTSDVNSSIKELIKIGNPLEILEGKSEAGRKILDRYCRIKQVYDDLLKRAIENKTADNELVFIYQDDDLSFSKDVANALLYMFPNKLIIIGREKGDEVKLSIRARRLVINRVLEKALAGVNGYGGGHEYACGACIKKDDFGRFLARFAELALATKPNPKLKRERC